MACAKTWFPSSEMHEAAMMKHTCNPYTQKDKARWSEILVILGYIVHLKPEEAYDTTYKSKTEILDS